MSTDLIFRKPIPLPRGGGTIEVRGLSLDDISTLLHANLPTITEAVGQYQSALARGFASRSMDEFALTVATTFPVLAADIIAIASDRLDEAADMRKLPAGVSIACLITIAELTLEDMGTLTDPSPALASLVRRTLAGAANRQPQNASPGSTGV